MSHGSLTKDWSEKHAWLGLTSFDWFHSLSEFSGWPWSTAAAEQFVMRTASWDKVDFWPIHGHFPLSFDPKIHNRHSTIRQSIVRSSQVICLPFSHIHLAKYFQAWMPAIWHGLWLFDWLNHFKPMHKRERSVDFSSCHCCKQYHMQWWLWHNPQTNAYDFKFELLNWKCAIFEIMRFCHFIPAYFFHSSIRCLQRSETNDHLFLLKLCLIWRKR